jgi:hypothetical protein
MEEAIAAWEDEGGSPDPSVQIAVTGTVNQIGWADQIKIQVDAEFGRVRAALEAAASKQSGQDKTDTLAIIAILEQSHFDGPRERELQAGLRTIMDLFTFVCEDDVGSCAPTRDRADSGSLVTARHRPNDRPDASAASNYLGIARVR